MIVTLLTPIIVGLAAYLAFKIGLLMVAFMLIAATLYESN